MKMMCCNKYYFDDVILIRQDTTMSVIEMQFAEFSMTAAKLPQLTEESLPSLLH